jgi:DNA-binding NarL/FixJ family response regulator
MESKNNSQFSIFNSQLIRVAIVDDHKIVVDGLERLINESETTAVIGKAYSVAECRALLKAEQPDVLHYIREGLTSTEITDKLCRSFDTVHSYRKALYIKLNAHSTRELISKAVELGLV